MYVACDILSGEYEVPNEMVHPFAVVTKDEVENYKDMGDEEIGTPTYDRVGKGKIYINKNEQQSGDERHQWYPIR